MKVLYETPSGSTVEFPVGDSLIVGSKLVSNVFDFASVHRGTAQLTADELSANRSSFRAAEHFYDLYQDPVRLVFTQSTIARLRRLSPDKRSAETCSFLRATREGFQLSVESPRVDLLKVRLMLNSGELANAPALVPVVDGAANAITYDDEVFVATEAVNSTFGWILPMSVYHSIPQTKPVFKLRDATDELHVAPPHFRPDPELPERVRKAVRD